jgi:hypothetical protein
MGITPIRLEKQAARRGADNTATGLTRTMEITHAASCTQQ